MGIVFCSLFLFSWQPSWLPITNYFTGRFVAKLIQINVSVLCESLENKRSQRCTRSELRFVSCLMNSVEEERSHVCLCHKPLRFSNGRTLKTAAWCLCVCVCPSYFTIISMLLWGECRLYCIISSQPLFFFTIYQLATSSSFLFSQFQLIVYLIQTACIQSNSLL